MLIIQKVLGFANERGKFFFAVFYTLREIVGVRRSAVYELLCYHLNAWKLFLSES